MAHKLAPIKIRGDEFTMQVTDYGKFQIYDLEGVLVAEADTFHDASTKADKRIRNAKRVRISVPFVTLHLGQLRPALIKGRHARTYRWLVYIDSDPDDPLSKGVSEEWETYAFRNHRVTYKREVLDDPKILAQRVKLNELKLKLEEKIEDWDAKYTYDPIPDAEQQIRERFDS